MIGRLALAVLLLGVAALPAGAMNVMVTSAAIERFAGLAPGERVQGLIWRGGLEMKSLAPEFGGLSGLTFFDADQHFAAVSDAGKFVSGQLIYDDRGRPLDIVGVEIDAIRNSKGNELPNAFSRDAEAIYGFVRDDGSRFVRVGFENLTRVADFSVVDNKPVGNAREVVVPEWISNLRDNTSLEAVCIAPSTSPVSGSTMLIIEGSAASQGSTRAFMLGHLDRGTFSISRDAGMRPTDCAFLPNGDMLLLERGTGFLSFSMRLRRVQASELRPGANLTGEVLLTASGADIDNMEGLGVHAGPDGETRIAIISDDNFNDWERSLLLEFALPESQ